ncbi:MAG: TetR/AcrR family transcriptional regulator [Porphyromonadaceae bacterium]|jgi:AcrR family transcriptional regulator|nr:TetR/AcrR family transcriptional regulator [Porphyromonadaceae bacterium]
MDEQTLNIIRAAATKFEQFGIRSVSIDNICNELRISKKTFYQVFPKKEDLVEAVLEFQVSLALEKFQKLYRGKNAIDALILIIKEVKKHTGNDYQIFFYDLEKYYPTIYNQYKEKKTEWIRVSFEENLRQGIEEGYYREDLDIELSSIFHAVQLKNSYRDIAAHNPKISMRRLNDFYIDVIVRLITNEKGLKYVEEQIMKD